MNRDSNLLLAGDIGGTKTVLALYRSDTWPGPPLRRKKYANSGIDRLERLLHDFLSTEERRPDTACFGVAGPVLGDRVRMTNLNWLIDARSLRQEFDFARVELVNDLVATAMGALLPGQKDLLTINPGSPDRQATCCVLAPGTGLGEAFVIRDRDRLLPRASEGGHAAFAPRNELQIDLLRFMRQRSRLVSVEQVCSGRAMPALFEFLLTRMPVPTRLEEELRSAADPTPVLVAAATGSSPCDIAVSTVQLFLDILAGEVANAALKTLALGGIYLGGGLLPRIDSLLDRGRFMRIFTQGVYKDMLAAIPVHLIRNPDTALQGAAACGFSFATDPA